jgi:anti-sigma factor RsiW
MNCANVQGLLHPFVDGELEVIRHVEIEEHLKQCQSCAEQQRQLRALREAVASASLGYRAPAALREKIRSTAAAPLADKRAHSAERVRPIHDQRRSISQLAAIAAGLLLLISSSAIVGALWRARGTGEDLLAEAVIAGHVRSLQANHLFDVPSSDRHTVKPWFKGKLDFSPEVPDLAAGGFALSGGRLDYLLDRPVAALVYTHRNHTINLFTWPAGNENDKPVRSYAQQGFHIRHWQQSGMTYWAISDLNDHELDEFARLFQEHASAEQR